MNDWLDNLLDEEEATEKRSARCAALIRDSAPIIWNKISIAVGDAVAKVNAKRPPGLIGTARFSKTSNEWTLQRIQSPGYQVTVSLKATLIEIVHEFSLNLMVPSDDVQANGIMFRCDRTETEVLMLLNGEEAKKIQDVVQFILEPLVTGQKPIY